MFENYRTIILIVLDSLGIGNAPDAAEYGDEGADTLGHLAEYRKIKIPNLVSLGIGNIRNFQNLDATVAPKGYYGRMREKSRGKGSTEGHWEIAGCITETPFKVFPKGFPTEIIKEFSARIKKDIIGNIPASGTEIIARYGDEHCATGNPIVYTSADSVFQIAACEEVVPIEKLYEWCEIAREMLTDEWNVVRVIARPFLKKGKKYIRTTHRKDYSVKPPCDTVLDSLHKNSIHVLGIGKIDDLFAGCGISKAIKTESNDDGMLKTIDAVQKGTEGLIFVNLVDFDMLYGHRNDAGGYIKALEKFDNKLGELLNILKDDDLLIITADHGCDPLHKGWDHTREEVPLLVHTKRKPTGGELGLRETFADVASTIAENFGVECHSAGKSFLSSLL